MIMALRLANLSKILTRKQKTRIETIGSSIPALRNYTSSNSLSDQIVTPYPPLTQPLDGLPPVQYAQPPKMPRETKITTLPNGLRVASEQRFGQFCTIGVVIDSGPRYEVAFPSGVSHFLEKLAFNSTQEFSNKDKILQAMEIHGGICDCQSSRDTFIYASSSDRRGLETATHVLAETVLRPKLDETEVDFARQIVQFELETLNMRPEQEPILMDRIHAAAYRGNTLGLPKLCPLENADKIDRDVLLSFLRLHHTPTRMVLAGVGVDHDELVKYAEKFFTMPATWELETLKNTSVNTVDDSIAQYTGGEVKEECDIPVYAGSDLPELAHVVIGLEGTSHEDPDFVASCVLNLMMGGGGSFSAGGPGKGMYTRLYTNVLNQHHWMYSATASNHAYKDTGLFCIHVSAPPQYIHQAVKVIIHEMIAMASLPGSEELRRAKTQLQSMLLMNLEARPVVFEDIGRQVLATGKRKKPEEFIEAIEKITAEDIQRVAKRFLSSPPSVAARGSIKSIPQLKDIQNGMLNLDGSFSKLSRLPNLSLFR